MSRDYPSRWQVWMELTSVESPATLARARRAKKMSLRELADWLSTPTFHCSHTTLHKLEAGLSGTCRVELAERLEEFFGFTPGQVFAVRAVPRARKMSTSQRTSGRVA